MSWPIRPVNELCELAADCVNKTAPTVDYETEFKMIRTTNVKNGFIDLDEVRYVTEEVFEKWTRRSKPRYGDVILTREAPVGEVGRFTSDDDKVFLGQRLFHYRPNPEKLDWNFLAYVLQSPPVQGRFKGMGFGATVDHVRVGDAERLPIPCPPLDVQKKIGDTLSAYDDLIENNRRRIQLLEQAARLLYKEWFVYLRFPGHEHVKVKGGVPEGWEKKPLSEIADITMGQSPQSVDYNEDGNGLPFHQGVTNFGVRFPAHQTYCTVQGRLAESGDILFSVRAPVGRINITKDKIVIGRGLAAIRSILGQQNLLFYALKSHFFKEDMIGGGAIFAAITKKDLYGVELLQSPDSVAQMFMEHVRPIDSQIENIHRSIDQLTKARDLLLPRLMNGKVAA
ncbi:MAG: restriction endonuclease subunit S [Gammaproteobacteria bacterium]